MTQQVTKTQVLNAVAVHYREDLKFLEEINSLSWALKVKAKAVAKLRREEAMFK